MLKRVIIALILGGIVAGGILGYKYYRWIYAPNTPEQLVDAYVYLYDTTTFDNLCTTLASKGYVNNLESFQWVARRMEFATSSLKTGRYRIEPSMSNYDLVQRLRLGEQEPVRLVIRSAWNIRELAGQIAGQLMIDSIQIMARIDSSFIPQTEYTKFNVMSLFIPNTYEVFWNISAGSLLDRMQREHDQFWDNRRKAAALEIGLSPAQVYTLASIVERETQARDERPTIAGVYLNRLERQMPLQADPTVLFALGDYTIRRVLNKHLEIDSPFNTYRYAGLPPGPIWMPSISSIDAVLNAEEHDYLFFCAKPDSVGRHAFATTLSEHLRNARAYQRWLNQEGIR